jgi:hypothetical protein
MRVFGKKGYFKAFRDLRDFKDFWDFKFFMFFRVFSGLGLEWLLGFLKWVSFGGIEIFSHGI